jgi:serine protease AprX
MFRPTASIVCPLCHDEVDRLLFRYHIDGEKQVIDQIRRQNPGWTVNDGLCSRCVDYYHVEVVRRQRILPEIGPYFPVRSADDFIVLPTPLRLDTDQRFTGKGITICFIDSGFYPHPDLVAHQIRIKAYLDITGDAKVYDSPPALSREDAWHGTMTSVVCAGDGYLSRGLYKGIANDAELVLIKVQDKEGKITAPALINALNWILENHQRYQIRVVNISLGVNDTTPGQEYEIEQIIGALTVRGIHIIVAAGNNETGTLQFPARSTGVTTVGGMNDGNNLFETGNRLYHSTYGSIGDSLVKPELVAHAIWIAAPILPGTREQTEAETLYQLSRLPEVELPTACRELLQGSGLSMSINTEQDATGLRASIIKLIQTRKFISGNYMHVDGTSFAAPIVSAIVAQLLEANPALQPAAIREILFGTAKRIENFPPERQGFGLVRPRRAILKTLKNEFITTPTASPVINRESKTIAFYFHNECAQDVALAGSFNEWATDTHLFEPGHHGAWKIEIPMLPNGKYQYKFLVDETRWVEDVKNPYREPDGFTGFNSILHIN